MPAQAISIAIEKIGTTKSNDDSHPDSRRAVRTPSQITEAISAPVAIEHRRKKRRSCLRYAGWKVVGVWRLLI